MNNRNNKQLDDCRVRILSTISHEIRTPMNAVIGFSEQLKKTGLTKEQEEFVDIILNNSNHLLYMLNDIVDSSKMRFGHLSLSYEVVSLQTLINNIEKKYSLRAQQSNLKFFIDTECLTLNYVRVDVKRVAKVLEHLLENALKFTKEGSLTLKVKTEVVDRNKCTLIFEVIDTGIGISADKLDHILDLFTQEDNSDTREFGGVGMGLSMSYELAKMMNATLRVESEKLQGSTFSFILNNVEYFSYDTALKSRSLHQKSTNVVEEKSVKYLDLELDEKAKLHLNDFIAAIEQQLVDEYNAILDKQNLDSYESWAKRLLDVSKESHNNVFQSYCEELLDVLSKFDIGKLAKILKDFTLLYARVGEK